MLIITLTLKNIDNEKIDFIINGNVAYGDNFFQDGNHNNGGWKVEETREEIRSKINEALSKR